MKKKYKIDVITLIFKKPNSLYNFYWNSKCYVFDKEF